MMMLHIIWSEVGEIKARPWSSKRYEHVVKV